MGDGIKRAIAAAKASREPAQPKPKLNAAQVRALATLAENPEAAIMAGTLSKLRKLGLVGHVVTHGHHTQKTTSPITDAGRARLAEVPS